jgi:mannose-6-phosphate isomerase-like protein (cupin superfamily)
MDKVNLAEGFAKIEESWRPRVAARLNGQDVKLVKLEGPFVWHHHEAEDELFLVLKGHLDMEFRDRTIPLEPGELLVVPRGVEHRPVAAAGTEVLRFEPAGVLNSGNVVDATYTAPLGQDL